MVVAYTGDKGEPELVPTGASPTFAADVTEVAAWFQAGRSFRKFATQAALIAADNMADNDLAQVDAIDGAFFKYDGTAATWVMHGVARFADSTARAAAITTAAQGYRAYIADKGWIEAYFAVYNVTTNPSGTSVAGWYPIAGALPSAKIQNYNATMAIANGTPTLVTTMVTGADGWAKDVTVSSGTLVIGVTGRYRIKASFSILSLSATGIRLAQITKNSASDTEASRVAYGPMFPNSSAAYFASPTENEVRLIAGDVLRGWMYQNTGGAVNLAKESDAGAAHAAKGNYLIAEYLGPIIGA